MQTRSSTLTSLAVAALTLAGLSTAAAQPITLQADDGSMEALWRLTSPSAGPADWIGVAYEPPFDYPFRVVSATMHYIDTYCCSGGICTDPCGDFVDWDRMIIGKQNLTADPAGLTPDLANPIAQEVSVRFPLAGGNRTSPPWTLTPYVWNLPANTIFDSPGRVFFTIKFVQGDSSMLFAVDNTSLNQGDSISTSDGFATRSSIWAFGNVGMRITVAPIFNLKLSASAPAPSFQLSDATSVPMLAMRVTAGESSSTFQRVRVSASGSGNDATAVRTVRLIVDSNADGDADVGEPELARGSFGSNDGFVDLAFARTIPAGAREHWLVVYDFAGVALGGQTFRARIAAPGDVVASAGTPYFSGAMQGSLVTIAGRFVAELGPASMAARVVSSGTPSIAPLQVRLRAINESFDLTRIAFTASGTLNDSTAISGVRLFADADSSGTLTNGDTLLANGSFPSDDGRLELSFAPLTVAAGTTRDLIAVYDLTGSGAGGQTFRAIIGLPTDLSATGVFSGAPPASGPRMIGGTPVIGNLATIGGALTAMPGAANPGPGTAQPSASNVPMLALALAADAEAAGLTSLRFESSGSGDEVTHVARARLWRDLNGNGVVDGGDAALGTPATFAGDDGAITFAFPEESIPAGATRLFLLTYDLSGAATGGETFTARLQGASSIAAAGVSSRAPITASGSFPITGGTRTLLGGFSVVIGPDDPAAARVQPGRADVPVLQLQLAAQGERFSISRLVLRAQGSLDDAAGISRIRLFRDLGTRGAFDGADVLLGASSFSADDGSASFTFSPALEVAAGTTERWLATIDLSLAPRPGETFRAALLFAADLSVSGALSGAITPQGLPLTGATHSIGGTLIAAPGPMNPAGGATSPSARDVVMLHLRLSATTEPITITGVGFTSSGTGNELTAVSEARLWVDADRDGEVDPVGDIPLGSAATFTANDGPITFTFPARVIAAATSEDWIVAYALSGSAVAGDTFTLSLSSATAVTASAPSGPLPRIDGAPVAGGAKSVLGSLALGRGTADPSPRVVARGASDVPILQIEARGVGEAFTVSRLSLDALGSLDDVSDLAGVTLLRDADRSGTRTPGDVVLAGPLPMSSDDGSVDFSGLQIAVPRNGVDTWLVTASLSPNAAAGATFRLKIDGAADVTASGLGARPVAPSGLPLSSTLLTVGGTVRVALGPAVLIPRLVPKSASGVEALQLALTADTEAATLTELSLRASGTGDDAAGLTSIELYADRDGDGRVGAGEPSLGSARFAANDGRATFRLSEAIQPGAPLLLLARLALNGTPAGGDTFRLSIDPRADVTVGSQSGAVTPAGSALSGAVITVGGGFIVSLGPQAPAGGPVNQAARSISVLQVEMHADNEACTVQSLVVSAAGSIDDARDVGAIRLVRDANDNGFEDFADTLLAGPVTYPRDDGAVTFALSSALGRNARERWLVVYDLAGTASDLETFQARVLGPADVTVSCAVSGAVAPVGPPIEGARFTIQEDGALVLRRSDQSPPAAFLAKGTVRAPVLAVRLAALVHPATIRRVVLTSSVSSGAFGSTLASIELFEDENQDGRLDRGDRLLAPAAPPDGAGRVDFTLANPLVVPTDEPVHLLGVVSVTSGASPGTRLALRIAAAADIPATGPNGPAVVAGAPVASDTMTIAGDLNVSLGRTSSVSVVHNDAADLIALDLVFEAISERFTVTSLVITAEGTLDPALGLGAVEIVRDEDLDGRRDAGEPVVSANVRFAQGSERALVTGLGEVIDPARRTRWLVLADLGGKARVDQTLTLSIAAGVDVTATGERAGATNPIGPPLVGPTFVVGRSLLVKAGPVALADRIVAANARDVPALQVGLEAFNEDITITRLSFATSGSLDDAAGLAGARLFRDADGDGAIGSADVELASAPRPPENDGALTFSPLAERITKNGSVVLLVLVDLAGDARAGDELTLRLADDADLTALGAVSGAVAASGAPVGGPKISVVGALNVRLGPSSPPTTIVTPGSKFPALQLEVFTQAEMVTIDQITLKVDGTADDGVAFEKVRLLVDMDGDGVAGETDIALGASEPDGNDGALVFGSLGLSIPADGSIRLLAEVQLAANAPPGGTLRLGLETNDHLRATGARSGALTAVGAPVTGERFTIGAALPAPTGEAAPDEGCSCTAGRPVGSSDQPALWVALALVLLGVSRSRRTARGRALRDRPT